MAHPNEDRLRKGYAAFNEGDLATIDELWKDDISWHSYGDAPFSGEFEGKQAIFEMFGTIPQQTDSFEMNLHEVLANDEHGVVLVDQKVGRNGQTVEAQAVHVYHFEGGKVSEAWIQPVNEDAIPDDFWD